jgi:hypothetical protein
LNAISAVTARAETSETLSPLSPMIRAAEKKVFLQIGEQLLVRPRDSATRVERWKIDRKFFLTALKMLGYILSRFPRGRWWNLSGRLRLPC